MFERAEALFPVSTTKLYTRQVRQVVNGDFTGKPEEIYTPVDDTRAIIRNDNNSVLGIASDHYRTIQNDQLLRFAEAIREDVDMDTVVVLRGGAKVAFTARIRGTKNDIVPGDTIHRNVVGYLGHDGRTAFGGMFTNTRVVCANTLGFALSDAQRTGKQFTIRHSGEGMNDFERILLEIDVARQSFRSIADGYREMANTPMSYDLYRAFLENIYTASGGIKRKGDTVESMPRKWEKLQRAWHNGLGSNIPGVAGTVWQGLNAITEVESSPYAGDLTRKQRQNKVHSALFGSGAKVIALAEEEARMLCC